MATSVYALFVCLSAWVFKSIFVSNPAVPSRAPNISQIYYTSSTSIRVHWDPLPQRYVHGRLLGYRVEYRRVEPGLLNIWKTEVVAANIHDVPIYGLKKYGAYVFQVGAFTRRGEGLLSKGYMIRTDEDGKQLYSTPDVDAVVSLTSCSVKRTYSLVHCSFLISCCLIIYLTVFQWSVCTAN